MFKHKIIVFKMLALATIVVAFIGIGASKSHADSNVDRTNVQVDNYTITDDSGNTISASDAVSGKTYHLTYNWDASVYGSDLHEGDYFYINLPDTMYFSQNNTQFDITTPDGSNVVAKGLVTTNANNLGGQIKVTFTKYVEGRSDIKGSVTLDSQIKTSSGTGGTTNNGNGTGNETKSSNYNGILVINKTTAKPIISNELVAKWAQPYNGSTTEAQWVVRINDEKGTFNNVTFSDALSSTTETYIPSTFQLSEVEYDQYGDVTNTLKTYSYDDIKDYLTISNDGHSFTYDFSKQFGEMKGTQWQLLYSTTYTPGTTLSNNFTFNSNEKSDSTNSAWQTSKIYGYSQSVGEGTLKITKVSATDTSKVLQGATFTVVSDDGSVSKTVTTNANGEAILTGLAHGSYTVTETAAPNGYQLDSTPQKVNIVSSQTTAITVKDDETKTSTTPSSSSSHSSGLGQSSTTPSSTKSSKAVDDPKQLPDTGDTSQTGVLTIATLALIAVVGTAIVKKVNNRG